MSADTNPPPAPRSRSAPSGWDDPVASWDVVVKAPPCWSWSWSSVTARMTATVRAATTSVPDHAWQNIEYPHTFYAKAEQSWISHAEVAEVAFTAFTSRCRPDHVTRRLVVRRFKRLQALASDGT